MLFPATHLLEIPQGFLPVRASAGAYRDIDGVAHLGVAWPCVRKNGRWHVDGAAVGAARATQALAIGLSVYFGH